MQNEVKRKFYNISTVKVNALKNNDIGQPLVLKWPPELFVVAGSLLQHSRFHTSYRNLTIVLY